MLIDDFISSVCLGGSVAVVSWPGGGEEGNGEVTVAEGAS